MQVKSEVIFRWEYPAWCKDEMLARKQQIKWPPGVPSPTNESYGRISVTATLLFSGHLILYRLDYMARKHRKEIQCPLIEVTTFTFEKSGNFNENW